MNQTTTLLEFLENAGARVRIYDMGRRIQKLPRDTFLKFENTQQAYPRPLQQQAWLGVSIIQEPGPEEPLIWFLRLPLDEQGKLVQASRDYFLHRLLEVAVEQQSASGNNIPDAFKDNPYIFKPRQDRMAVFHAKLKRDLKQPPSRFYQHALDYFSGKLRWDQWNFVGYQGIADIAARSGDVKTAELLATAIPKLPDEPLIALCHCLENEPVPYKLAKPLTDRLSLALRQPNIDPAFIAALIRGLSQAASKTIQQEMLDRVMRGPASSNAEVLAALSGRAWDLLASSQVAARYLEKLAANDQGQEIFNQCTTDLLGLPGMREHILSAIRSPQRSDQLASAFSRMTKPLLNN